jgi:hypothetical protein
MATLLEAIAADESHKFKRAKELYQRLDASPLRKAARFFERSFPQSIDESPQ